MSTRAHVRTAQILFVILVALHLDFWRGPRTALYFGWLPQELAYRLGWMALAALYLLYVCAFVWRDAEDEPSE